MSRSVIIRGPRLLGPEDYPLAPHLNIGDLYFSFRGDSKQLELDAKKGGKKAGTTLGSQLTKALKTGDWGTFVKAGLGIGAGLAVFSAAQRAIGGVMDEVSALTTAASDLEESQSKVNQVFTDSADVIHEWASSSAEDFGLSKAAALEAAGTFGNFIQALGGTEDQANDMSRSLVELAADLASFNNMEVDDVLTSLRSGLSGEAEPMRKLGADISAARVEAILLADGIKKVNGKFTEAQKVQARYKAIIKDTNKAQGDFQRTSDGLANKQRILNARMEDFRAALGGIIVGPATDFVGFLTDLIDLSPDVTERVRRINEIIAETAKVTQDVADAAEELEEEWKPLTEMDLPAFARVGMYKDLGAELVEYANKMQLTNEELNDLVWLNNDATGSLEKLRDGLRDAYYAYDPLSSVMVRTGAAAKDAATDVDDATDDMAKSTREYAKKVSLSAMRVVKTFADLPTSIQDEIKNGKGAVRDAMTELKWAMQHPFADEKYAEWLRKKQAKANRKLVKAIADGNEPAANQARALVTAIQTELDQLANQTYSVDVVVDSKTGRRRPGAAPGRAAGGPVEADRAYWVGEQGPELVVPRSAATVLPTPASIAAVAGGGSNLTIPLEVYGLPMQAETPLEVAQQAARAARLGVLTPSHQQEFKR